MMRFTLIVLILFVLINSPKLFAETEQDSVDQLINTQALKFKYILETAKKYHADSLDFLKITDEVLKEMLQKMDKQSVYFTKKEVELLKENNTGKTFSPGIDIQKINDTITVVNIVDGSSADLQGIQLGDKIIEMNGDNYKDKSINYIKSELNGDSASTIDLKIFRKIGGEDEIDISVQRLDVEIPSITSAFLISQSGTGYIKINRFSELADDEFKKESETMLKSGMKKLIIDLRGNSGGSLEASSKIIDYFLPEGKMIAYTDSKNENFKIEKISTQEDFLKQMPVVILVDENTASGSELIAAVIQDYDRGLVVGQRTYGKGSIQKVWYMNDGSAFKLTVGEYHSPVGRNLQKPIEKDVTMDESADLSIDKNVQQKIIDDIKKIGSTKIDTYESFGGRTILGGGGVWPDKFSKKDTLTTLTKVLIVKGIFNEYAIRYLSSSKDDLQNLYGDDFLKYVNEFQLTDEMLQDFANLAVNEFNVWNKEMFAVDKVKILYYIKASIAHFLWGNNGYTASMLPNDKVFKEGIKYFDEAEKLLNSKIR
jgi:carboxyl-terminal processing protease